MAVTRNNNLPQHSYGSGAHYGELPLAALPSGSDGDIFYHSGSNWTIVSLSDVAIAGSGSVLSGSYIARTDGTEDVTYVAAAGATHTIEDPTRNIQDITLTANAVFTMPTPVDGKSFTVRQRQDGTGGWTATYTDVEWPGGVAPTATTDPDAIDVYAFHSDGVVWFGSYAGATTSGGSDTAWIVDPGTPSYSGTGPITVALTSKWGIDSSGNPYYNAANVTDGEEAALVWDSVTGSYLLRPYYP